MFTKNSNTFYNGKGKVNFSQDNFQKSGKIRNHSD